MQKNVTLWEVQPYKWNWQFSVHCLRTAVSNVRGKPCTKQKLYFSERHLSSVCLTCSYLIDLLQLRVCRKANDVTYIELSKIIFIPVNVLDISSFYVCVELGLSYIREENRLKVLKGRVI